MTLFNRPGSKESNQNNNPWVCCTVPIFILLFMIKMTNMQKAVLPFAIVVFEIMLYLSNDLHLPALPIIANHFSIDMDYAQHTISMWFLGSLTGHIIIGPSADYYGKRFIFLLCSALFMISTAICCIATEIKYLILGRFFQGAMIPCIYACGYTIINQCCRRIEAIKIFVMMGMITILAPACGPIIGVLILKAYHWRYIFYTLFFASIISFILLYISVPQIQRLKEMKGGKILKNYMKIINNVDFRRYSIFFGSSLAVLVIWIVESIVVINNMGLDSSVYAKIMLFVFSSYFFNHLIIRKYVNRFDLNHIVFAGISIMVISIIFAFISAIITDDVYIVSIFIFFTCIGRAMCASIVQRINMENIPECTLSQKSSMNGIITSLIVNMSIFIQMILFKKHNLTNMTGAMMVFAIIAMISYYRKHKYITSEQKEELR